jgi:hypothetical protein
VNPLRAVNADVRAEAYRQAHHDGDHRACSKDTCPTWVAHFEAYPEDQAAIDRWTQR